MPQDSQLSSPSDLAREIKGLNSDYKDSLKKAHSPSDRDVEFQRQNIRRHILQLMFTHPHTSQSQALEGPLWMDTTYALIAAYRTKISQTEEAVKSHDPRGGKTKNPGPVELRKLVTRFRAFLSAEETFWSELALRLTKTYDLKEAIPALAALSISATDPAVLASKPGDPRARHPSPTPELVTPVQKEKKLLFVHKVLVSLGDLARYREQYNEAGGKPRAGHDDHRAGVDPPLRQGRGGRRNPPLAQDQAPRARNYTKAAECYQQARILAPDYGNPSNQLAILALYGGDTFSATMYYYRALCALSPFPTAKENLEKTLQRSIDTHRKLKAEAGATRDGRDPIDILKSDIVLLHALWLLKPKASNLTKLSKNVTGTFTSLVSSRSLPPEMVVKILTMAFGALWNARALKGNQSSHDIITATAEVSILVHIIYLLRSLAKIGVSQIKEAVQASRDGQASGDVEGDNLAQFITATFRRTLPALHIGSKWLRSNIEYLREIVDTAHPAGSGVGPGGVKEHLVIFWASYVSFAAQMSRAFSFEKLPKLYAPLEEDVDLKGFAPLKQSLLDLATDKEPAIAIAAVHPNEEHLMRIRELLVDAYFIASQEKAPIHIVDNVFVVGSAPLDHPSTPTDGRPILSPFTSPTPGARFRNAPPVNPNFSPSAGSDDQVHPLYRGTVFTPVRRSDDERDDTEEEADDDNGTVSTEDPVRLAMGATLGEDDDDEEEMEDERVLYPQRTTSSSPLMVQPMNPVISNAFPPPLSSASSPSRNGVPMPRSTTAEDLLSRVLGGGGASSMTMAPRGRASPQQQQFSFSASPPISRPTWNTPSSPVSHAYSTVNHHTRSAFQTHSPNHSQQMGYALPVPASSLSQDSVWSSQASVPNGPLSLSQGPYPPVIGNSIDNSFGARMYGAGSDLVVGAQLHHTPQQLSNYGYSLGSTQPSSTSGVGPLAYPYGAPPLPPFQSFAASSRPWS